MSHSLYPSVSVLSLTPSFSFSPLALRAGFSADGIRGGLSGLGVSAGIDRAVPVSPQVAGKYEKMRRGASTLPNTVSPCHVLLSFPWVLYVTWEYSCWRLETREGKKKKEKLSPGWIFRHPSQLPTTYLADLLQAMPYYL